MILRRVFVMDPFNIGKLPFEEASSSSSSDDDIPVLAAFLQQQEQVQQKMLLLAQLASSATVLMPSASSPRMKKRSIEGDREAAHDRLYKDYFAEDSVYNAHHF